MTSHSSRRSLLARAVRTTAVLGAALVAVGTLAHYEAVFALLPMAWLVGPVAILGCLYLFSSLPTKTQLWCLLWNAFGVLVYLAYARRNSLLAKGRDA